MDACLSSITDDPSFWEDLKGISDTAAIVATMKELKNYMKNRAYQYIIWETPFLIKQKFKTVLNCCLDALRIARESDAVWREEDWTGGVQQL